MIASSVWCERNRLDLIAARSRGLRLAILRLRIDRGVVVAVVVPHPGHRPGEAAFIAPLWGEIEEIVGADQDIEAAAVGRIGVKHLAGVALAEHAGAGALLARKVFDYLVIVQHLAAGLFFRRKGDLIIGIEIAAERRHPFEAPAHALLERLDFGERGARDD